MIRRFGGWIHKHRMGITVISLVLVTAFWFCLPQRLFNMPYSMVLTDRNGRLLQARISDDGQWRFPFQDSLPPRYKQALILFEDQRFYLHPGVDFLALGRAVVQNARSGKVVSGASTISMQVVRLSHGKRKRNLLWKILEFVQAFRLECRYSKEEILQLYAGHAPFGGNVVGIGAASWRYFGRHPHELSWAELATLAVLPNTPSLMHPGRNRSSLKTKRDRLLDKLLHAGIIDTETNRLSKLENIPDKPLPLPQLAPHLLSSLKAHKISFQPMVNQSLQTTLDLDMQTRVADLLYRHHQHLKANGINNAAAIVMEVESGNVLAYVGNVYQPDRPYFDSHVDVITAPRSPGSTLKPLLFEAMLSDGLILPKSLIPDVPTQIGGYKPQNFDLSYDGAVPASKALSRSLNIPAVRMLQQYRTERFHARLRQLGVSTLTKPP
jgi:penicillin-binding protein 1C